MEEQEKFVGAAVETCRAAKRSDGPWMSRCTRKATRDGYCTQHHPDKVAARRNAINDRMDREIAEINRRNEERARRARLPIDALRSIASGHNDPARLARETLEKLGMQKECAE